MAKKSSTKKKEKYSAQRNITEKNRERKRLKHLKKYPNDLQTAELVGKA